MDTIRWCRVHRSVIFRPADDPYDFWLCYASNVTGDRRPCDEVLAVVSGGDG